MKTLLFLLLFPLIISAQTFPWAIGEGGVGADIGKNIRFDQSGNLLLCGDVAGNPTFRGVTYTGQGLSDGFVAKYDVNGGIQWVQLLGGAGVDKGSDCVADKNNNVFVTGYFETTMSAGNQSATSKGKTDVYVAKFDASGNVQWLKTFGGLKDDQAYSIATDNNGNIFLCGIYTSSIQFGNITLTTANGFPESFIAKLDNNGNPLWAKSSNAAYTNTANSLCVLPDGDVAVTGYFSLNYKIDSTTVSASSTNYEVFIARLNNNGDLKWLKSAGGSYDDASNSICNDANGNVFITGFSSGAASFDAQAIGNSGYNDPFVAKYNNQGVCEWARRGEGTKLDIGNGISCDQYGNVFATGFYEYSITFSGRTISGPDRQIFMVSYDTYGNIRWLQDAGESGSDYGLGISADGSGNVYTTGYYFYRCIFGSILLPLPESNDIFLAKYTQPALGIADETIDAFSFYPNPAISTIYFKEELPPSSRISVFNAVGELISTTPLLHNNLDISGLNNGIYSLQVDCGKQQTVNRKLVVCR